MTSLKSSFFQFKLEISVIQKEIFSHNPLPLPGALS